MSARQISQRTLAARLLDALPQTQCQACGYAGCQPYAEALALGQAQCNLCPPGGKAVWRRLCVLSGASEDVPPQPYQPHRLHIDLAKCIGCYKCVRACPVDAIVGAPQRLHQINQAACTGCDLCLPVCPVDCIDTLPRADADAAWANPHPAYAARRSAFAAHTSRLAASLHDQRRRVARQAHQPAGSQQVYGHQRHTIRQQVAVQPVPANQLAAATQSIEPTRSVQLPDYVRSKLVRALKRAEQQGDTAASARLHKQLAGLKR